MDMSTDEENFIARALKSADKVDARWIGNQTLFNGPDEAELVASARAAVITSVAILSEANDLGDEFNEEALEVKTKGQARDIIKKVTDSLPPY